MVIIIELEFIVFKFCFAALVAELFFIMFIYANMVKKIKAKQKTLIKFQCLSLAYIYRYINKS